MSIKNVSKRDILLLKQRFTRKFPQPPLPARLFLMRSGKKYREGFVADRKSMAAIPARKEDFVLLRPNDIYRFTRRTLIYPLSMAKKFWNTEVNLGHMAVSREGAHQMQVKYEAWDLPIAKGVDLGGLKPWKGVLLSGQVDVVVGKAAVKPVAKPVAAGRKAS